MSEEGDDNPPPLIELPALMVENIPIASIADFPLDGERFTDERLEKDEVPTAEEKTGTPAKRGATTVPASERSSKRLKKVSEVGDT